MNDSPPPKRNNNESKGSPRNTAEPQDLTIFVQDMLDEMVRANDPLGLVT
jgi:hypothetical protein